eukprot:1469508-Amphidinium_carterae.1
MDCCLCKGPVKLVLKPTSANGKCHNKARMQKHACDTGNQILKQLWTACYTAAQVAQFWQPHGGNHGAAKTMHALLDGVAFCAIGHESTDTYGQQG